MDWRSIVLGLGLSLVFGLLQYAVKSMPNIVSWPGICIGVLLIIWGFIPRQWNIPYGPAILFLICCAGITASVAWYFNSRLNITSQSQARSFPIADCTMDIIFQMSEHDFKILQTSRSGVENGFLTASVDIFEKDKPGQFVQMTVTGEWHGTDGRINDSINNLTQFSLRDRRFMFFDKKLFIGNAQSGMTHLFSNKKYRIRIRGVTTSDQRVLILMPINSLIRTHEGIVFPTTNFERMKDIDEYWQAEFPSVSLEHLSQEDQ